MSLQNPQPNLYIPDTKHTISSFSSEMIMLTETYCAISYSLFNSNENVIILQSYRKMLSATVREHNYKPNLRPPKILFFFIHAILVGSTFIDNSFVYVRGPCITHYITRLVNRMKFGAAH